MTNKMNKIMIGLDLTNHDERILTYSKYLNSILTPKNLHFAHVEREVELSEELISKFPELAPKIDDVFLTTMKKEINEEEFPNTNIHTDIYHGSPLNALLEHAKEDHFELLILGKQDNGNQVEKKIARKIPTNIWFVPKTNQLEIKSILVPIDFSEDSIYALETAIEIAQKSNARITCQNVYEVPKGYSKTGKSFEEFAEIMKQNAYKTYERLLATVNKNDVNFTPPILSLNNNEIIGNLILKEASRNDFDLIVIGARGRTKWASIFIGSVAENLIESKLPCPLLLTKKDLNSLLSIWKSIIN